ncbi:TIGR03000 domain-containing protein [Tuwongella immobilis]|nr:TIGR03000 domain-containing protein [Tuwongella immobilis]
MQPGKTTIIRRLTRRWSACGFALTALLNIAAEPVAPAIDPRAPRAVVLPPNQRPPLPYPPGWYGPGAGFGPYPFFGYYPGAYQGFYSNGFSLNGPPIPTFSPTPGTFGGNDQRFYGATVPFGMPFGIGVFVGPQRRGEPLAPGVGQTMPNLDAIPFRNPPALLPTPIRVTEPTPAMLEVIVPESAQLTLDGHATTPTGSSRRFITPKLEPGQQYRYQFEATWNAGGTPIRQSREVKFHAGESIRVDLTQPDSGS